MVLERSEEVSFTLKELVLEFDPMETKGVKETLQLIHAHEHKECYRPEDWPKDDAL